MEPVDTPAVDQDQTDKIGILVTNLGTPAAPTAAAVRPYLREFLSDRRVVDLPRLLWLPILELIILNLRPRQSAKAYAQVWGAEGSPLAVNTRNQANALAEVLRARLGERAIVEFAFRYGQPSIASAIESLTARGARKLLVLPMYPQYSATTVGSTFDAVADCLQGLRWVPELRMITHYHDHPRYISALAESIKAHWQQQGRAKKLLFSFHGIPQRFCDNGDPYYEECMKTASLVAQQLDLQEDEYLTAFQSRVGREPWIGPYTDEVLLEWAGQGMRSVQVICPGFSADCLETLEEIAIRYRQLFIRAGGERFDYIPALNSDAGQVELMTALVRDHLQGWMHSN
jgi:ferrochelatase